MLAPKLALMSLGLGALSAPVNNEARDDGPYNVVGLTLLSLVPAYTPGAAPQASSVSAMAPGAGSPDGSSGGSPPAGNTPGGNAPGGVPGSAGSQPTATVGILPNGGTGVGIISVVPVGTSSSTSVYIPGRVSVEPVAGSTTAIFIPTAPPQSIQTQSSVLQPLPSQSQTQQPSQPVESQTQQPGGSQPQPQPGASSPQPGQPGPSLQSGEPSQPVQSSQAGFPSSQPVQSSQPAQLSSQPIPASSQAPQPGVSQPQPGTSQPQPTQSSAPAGNGGASGQPAPVLSSPLPQSAPTSSSVVVSEISTSVVFSVEPVDGGSSSVLIPVTSVPVLQTSQPVSSEQSSLPAVSSSTEISPGVSPTSIAEQSTAAASQSTQVSSDGLSSEPATTLSSQATDTDASSIPAAVSSFTPATDQPMPTPVVTLATGDDGSVSTSLLSVAVPLPSALPSVPLSSDASPPASSVAVTTAVVTTDGSTITSVITTAAAATSEPVTSTFVTVISSDDFTTTATITSTQSPSAAPSSSTSTAAATTTLPAVVSRPKRGLVYNDASLAQPFLSSGAIAWGYNWYSSSGGLDPSISYVPMMWGTGSDVSLVRSAVDPTLSRGAAAPYLLTYNEPDETTQYGGSAITPSAAAAAWAAQIAPLASSFPSLRISSPAVTSYNTSTNGPLGASGLSWLSAFVGALPNATGDASAADAISFVALHWYGATGASGSDQAAGFRGYVEAANADVNRIFGREVPLWITEFSPLPIGDQQVAADFLDEALPWLDAYGPVQRYSFFMDAVGELVDGNKALTQSGRVYIS